MATLSTSRSLAPSLGPHYERSHSRTHEQGASANPASSSFLLRQVRPVGLGRRFGRKTGGAIRPTGGAEGVLGMAVRRSRSKKRAVRRDRADKCNGLPPSLRRRVAAAAILTRFPGMRRVRVRACAQVGLPFPLAPPPISCTLPTAALGPFQRPPGPRPHRRSGAPGGGKK